MGTTQDKTGCLVDSLAMIGTVTLFFLLREIQRDWYGKRCISLHGLLAIAQVNENKKVSEVLDLWSEDTKQDSWFTQSAMDVAFNGCKRHFLASECICFLVRLENCVQ